MGRLTEYSDFMGADPAEPKAQQQEREAGYVHLTITPQIRATRQRDKKTPTSQAGEGPWER